MRQAYQEDPRHKTVLLEQVQAAKLQRSQEETRYREVNREYMAPQERSRNNAMRAVRIAIRKGILKRQPCEICGKDGGEVTRGGQIRPIVHAHHDDYNFPLHVRWLCKSHHHSWHIFNMPVAMKSELLGIPPLGLFHLGSEQLRVPVQARQKSRKENNACTK